MADETLISWADESKATGRKRGAHKSAANKAGCTLDEWYSRRSSGNRWCYRCKCWKETAQFSLDKTRQGGMASICKPCNSHRSTRSRYGLTEERYARLQAVGACAICERAGIPMEVDHNHATGAVRAILCSRCNNGIAMFCDDVALMKRAISYIEVHNHG